MKQVHLLSAIKESAIEYCRAIVGLFPFCFIWLLLMGLLITSCNKTIDPPKPPVLKATVTTLAGTVGTKIILDGTATSGSSSTGTLTYLWTIKSAPAGSAATLLNANTATPTLLPDKSGMYVLTLLVTDTGNNTSVPTDFTLNVSLPGKPPVISTAQSATVEAGQNVSLDGSKSSDPDSDKLTYQWVFKSKPISSAAVLTNANQAVAGFTADVVGTYVVTFTISDGIWPPVSTDVSITAVTPAFRTISGSWTATDGTSGGTDYTPRNKFYSFVVATNNQPVSLSVTSSDINVGVALYDPLGNQVSYRGTGRSIVLDNVVNAGTYSVMVYSGQRYDIGSFRLTGRGLSSEFTPILTKRVMASDVSFGSEGGGGTFQYTSRNHYYTFDVTEDNVVVDINAQSAQTGIWLDLYDSAGKQQGYANPSTPQALIRKLNKGTYGLWVGSANRDDIAKYSLDIFGQVQNLKQYVYDSAILADNYIGKDGRVTYSLNVTEDNTPLDITLRSPDIAGYFNLYDPNGSEIGYSNYGSYQFLYKNSKKGQYKIIVTPVGNSGIGKYTLSVYGKFSDLKKQ